MNISKNIPIDANKVLNELRIRQGAPWNGDVIRNNQYPYTEELFSVINSGVEKEDFFFSGDLFRIHPAYIDFFCNINPEYEFVLGKINTVDRSCSILRKTQYSDKLASFTQLPDYTDRSIWNKIIPSERAIFIHVNTGKYYGIDVNKFQQRFEKEKEHRFEGEKEILFPIWEQCVVKEYLCSANQFKYYLRRYVE